MGNNCSNLCSCSSDDRFRFKQYVVSLYPNSSKNNSSNNSNNNSNSQVEGGATECHVNSSNNNNNNASNDKSVSKLIESKFTPQQDVLEKLMSYLRSNPERIPRVCRKVYKLLQSHLEEGKMDEVNVAVYTLCELLNKTNFVAIFTPHALQIIALLLAYFDNFHSTYNGKRNGNGDDDSSNNNNADKNTDKKKKNNKRRNHVMI